MPQEAKKPGDIKLDRARFHGAEFERLIWVANVEQGTRPEDVLDAGFWGNVSGQLGPFHRIECRCEDGTWISELLVLEAGRSYARVKELARYLLTTADVAQSQDAPLTGFKVYWRGVHHRWAVKRMADNEVIHNGESTAAAANEWLREHVKALAA